MVLARRLIKVGYSSLLLYSEEVSLPQCSVVSLFLIITVVKREEEEEEEREENVLA